MRVLHISSGNLYGGVETLLISLARLRHLCPTMEPHFALSFKGRLSDELMSTGVPVYHLGPVRISRLWTMWRARYRLQELLCRERFDWVVCHMSWPLTVFGKCATESGHKLALWVHSLLDERHWLDRWARRVGPHLVICNSRFTAATAAKLLPGVRNEVLYCPVAMDRRERGKELRSLLRKELNASEDTVVILQAGRLEPGKGHALHLRALSLLRHLSAPWVCWIAGSPQRGDEQRYLDDLHCMVKLLGIADRVKFIGHRSDIPELMAAADIFCQPNQRPEGFGIVFIEALSAGCPVISTRMGGAVEIVDDSCGLLVRTTDHCELAELLRRLIESSELRARLGSSGRNRAFGLCDPTMRLQELNTLLASGAACQGEPLA